MADGTFTNGQLIQVGSDYYLIIFQQACLTPDDATRANLFGADWLGYVQQADSIDLPFGPPFTAGACIIQAGTDPPAYLYTWGLAFQIDPSIQSQYHFDTAILYTNLPQTLVEAMPKGFVIAE